MRTGTVPTHEDHAFGRAFTRSRSRQRRDYSGDAFIAGNVEPVRFRAASFREDFVRYGARGFRRKVRHHDMVAGSRKFGGDAGSDATTGTSDQDATRC